MKNSILLSTRKGYTASALLTNLHIMKPLILIYKLGILRTDISMQKKVSLNVASFICLPLKREKNDDYFSMMCAEHFAPLMEQITKLEEALYNIQFEQHWIEAQTDRQAIGSSFHHLIFLALLRFLYMFFQNIFKMKYDIPNT